MNTELIEALAKLVAATGYWAAMIVALEKLGNKKND